MITLENWRMRMGEDMLLRDYRPRTREGYGLAVRLFLDWAKREPEELTEEEIRSYFLYLREEKKQAPSSINIAVCALRFFCVHTLVRDWPVFELLKVNKPKLLPVVLSTGEVRKVLGAVRHPVRRMALVTIYALGLRLGEGLRLETGHVDAERLIVWVRDGKGAKDRGVPLPRPLLTRLRGYWKEQRPQSPTKYLFVPEGRLVRSHQKALLSVLMRTAFESLAALCADAQFLGGQIGALAVLHTWTRTLEWHPHVHLLVPGGALAPDGRTWVGVKGRRKRFLVPVKALSKHFRGRFLHRARRALPREVFPDIPWGKRWVVFAKPVVQGPERVLEYLGRYVHRTALMGKAIVACDDESVTFAYRDSRDHQKKTMKLPGHEFLRRFLQHVPPKGFHRVRAFGLLHAAHRQTLARLQLLLAAPPAPCAAGEAVPSGTSKQRCPVCQQALLLVSGRLSPAECLAWALRQEARVDATARAPPSRVSLSPGAAAA